MAGRPLVNELLKDGGVQHGESGDEETGVDTLDGREVDSELPETGVDEVVEDWDEDDDGDGVQVLDQVVGSSVQGHSGGDGTQVTIDLGVAQPEEGEPTEDLASLEGTSDFTNELVVPCDLSRGGTLFVGTGLGDIPETRLLEVAPGRDGVQGDPGSSSHREDTDTLKEGRGVSDRKERIGRRENEPRG